MKPCDCRAYEYALAIYSMAWGAQLAWPGFVDFTRSAYRVMAAFAPSWAWGALVALAGTLLMWSLYTRRQWWRKRSLSALFILWLAVALCLGIPNWRGTGLLTYFFVAAVVAVAHTRVGHVQ